MLMMRSLERIPPPANNRRISDIATEIVPATIPPTKNVLEETRTLVNANLT